jgi:NADH dehydrogenase
VNCVGTFDAKGKNNFDAVQNEGAARVARLAAENGVGALVHLSAIGADAESESLYAQSKAAGEAAILESFPNAVILRPSVVFGPEDSFFNRFAGMAATSPVIPLVGGNTKFQPVYVDDVAKAAVAGVTGTAEPGVYELGGPDVATFSTLIKDMLKTIRRRRLVINQPFIAGRFIAWSLDLAQTLTGGLFNNSVLTKDQVRSLRSDNVVSDGAKTLADLGIKPTAMGAILPDYLWRFRPSGQYDAIKESAKNLRPQ